MPRRIVIAPHLPLAELEQRYRRAADPIASRHWQIVWLLAQGRTGQHVAASTGYSPRWIGLLAQRYNAQGPMGLGDHRHQNPGSARVLAPPQEAALATVLASPAPDGGLWTGPKVAAWITTTTGRAVSAHLGWVSLRRLGFTPRRPRPRHADADAAAQAAFPQTLTAVIAQVQADQPEATVESWAMDEHRVGLKPILRRVWARRGQPVRAVVRPRYEWEYVYGFVQPEQGTTHWLLLPTVNQEAFTAALVDFARDQGVGPTKQIVLALDGAGYHSGTAVAVPAGLHLVPLPPYSPELQPAERLWPLVNEPLANRAFGTLAALDTVLGERCVYLAEHPEVVRGYTDFHWWPRASAISEAITPS